MLGLKLHQRAMSPGRDRYLHPSEAGLLWFHPCHRHLIKTRDKTTLPIYKCRVKSTRGRGFAAAEGLLLSQGARAGPGTRAVLGISFIPGQQTWRQCHPRDANCSDPGSQKNVQWALRKWHQPPASAMLKFPKISF